MAKAKNAKPQTTKEAAPKKEKKAKVVEPITVQDLANEAGMEPRKIRQIIRNAGFRAPAVAVPEGGFGPRAKYGWQPDDEDLAKIREAIEAKKAGAAKPKKAKKAKKVVEPEEDIEEIEDDEDEDEDEDDDDDDDDSDDDDDDDDDDEDEDDEDDED